MKTFTFTCLLLFLFLAGSCRQQLNEAPVEELVAFLEQQPLTAKAYILEQFKEKDIVILCERHHGDISQYRLYLDIISDPWFIDNVGAVYREVGMASQSARLNDFLMREGLDSTQVHLEVTRLLRDANWDAVVWACHSYPWLIREVYQLNRELDASRKIRMYGCDCSVDWEEWDHEAYAAYDALMDDERDSIMADNFFRQFEAQPLRGGGKKALVIQNFRHAFLQHNHHGPHPEDARLNFGKYMHDRFGDKLASVWVAGLAMPERMDQNTVVKDGKWEAAFELAGKTDVGFTLRGTPFGEAPCDLSPGIWPVDGFRYQDIFTGLVHYLPIEEHTIVYGWEGTFTDDFLEEFLRRYRIAVGEEDDWSDEELQEYMESMNRMESSKYYDLEGLRAKIDRWKQ